MFRLKSAAAVALILAVGACTGDAGSPTAPDVEPQTTISDAAHAGAVPGFYFLPPMVPAPSYSGTFDGGLQPRVEICELGVAGCTTVIAQYTTTSGTGGQTVQVGTSSYQVNWHTNQFNLDPTKHYRISVYVGSLQLGFADVDVVSTGKELKNVDTQEYIPLQDDRTLPIKFRIETGIAGQVIVSPDSAEIPVGGTQQFTATVLDLHGNPLACGVAWSSDNTAAATVDGNGLATGVAPGAAIITATCQAASGSAILMVINPNTPPVAQADTFEAIGNVTVPVDAPGVLANDTDAENNTLQAVAGTFPTTGGGTVTINADGSFTYLSAAGFTGEDSFTYTVTDGTDSASGTATVTSAYRVWYVDNATAGPGDGRDASPFSTLAGAEGASTAGETVFVRTGTAPYDGGFALKTGQSLTGQGVPANVTATLNGQTVVLLAAGSAPTITQASGATIQLATNNVVQGVDVTSAAGAGIAGSGFGTLTVGSISVNATGGPALDLSSGDVAGTFDALSSSGSTGAGIRLVGVGGAFSAASGSITTPAGAGVEVIGGDAVFSYGGDVAVAGPAPVSVTGRSGGALTFAGTIASTGQGISVQNNSGGSVAFTGSSKSLATGANPGVSLANNTGATISFGGGGLVIATTSGDGFSATGGGTVTVTGAGNTITSAGGAAVRVENTAIGGAGLTFVSVSATGGTSGIVLNNTGALNGLQVTGTGAAGSGGTIQGTTGAGASLNGVRSVVLSYMSVTNAGASGIDGANVTGFTLSSSTVSGNGNAPGEAGVAFSGLFGTASIANSTITGSADDNLRVQNSTGTLVLSMTASTVSSNGASGNDGVRIEALGSADITATVIGSTFTANRGDHFQAVAGGSADLDVGFSGNVLSGGHPSALGQGLTISALGSSAFSGTVRYDVASNIINGAITTAVLADLGLSTAAAVFSGHVRQNLIGTTGAALSCSTQGSGISVDARGHGTHTVAIVGNTLRNCFDRGITTQANDGDGALNLTVTGNKVAELVAPSSREGFFLNAGSFSPNVFGAADSHTVCLDLGGAAGLANSLTHGPSVSTDFRLRQRFATAVRLPGYAGANNDAAAVVSFVSSRNGGASGTAQVTVPPGGGYVGGAACPQP
jgi:hypothetical protein